MDSTIKRDWQIFRMEQNEHLRMVIYALWMIRRSNRVLQN